MSKDLRLVFMGTPAFAVASLAALATKFTIAGVVTAPDKPAGRGHKISESAVKQYAKTKGWPILQPTKLKSPEFLEELRALQCDLQVVVAFRMLPEVVWDMPPLGTINLHASLLPNYRGAAPINHAIINGEKESGVTTFFLQHEIDTGHIIQQAKVPIDNDTTAGDLHDELMTVGAALLLETVQAIADDDYTTTPQDTLLNDAVKEAPKIFKEHCKINWNQSAATIHNMVRGLSPYPAAWSELHNDDQPVMVKLYKTSFTAQKHTATPGTITTDHKTTLQVAATDGWITVHEMQVAGKRRMPVADLLRGFKIAANSTFK